MPKEHLKPEDGPLVTLALLKKYTARVFEELDSLKSRLGDLESRTADLEGETRNTR